MALLKTPIESSQSKLSTAVSLTQFFIAIIVSTIYIIHSMIEIAYDNFMYLIPYLLACIIFVLHLWMRISIFPQHKRFFSTTLSGAMLLSLAISVSTLTILFPHHFQTFFDEWGSMTNEFTQIIFIYFLYMLLLTTAIPYLISILIKIILVLMKQEISKKPRESLVIIGYLFVMLIFFQVGLFDSIIHFITKNESTFHTTELINFIIGVPLIFWAQELFIGNQDNRKT